MSNRDKKHETIDDYVFIDSSSLDLLAQEPSLETNTEGLRKAYNFRLRYRLFPWNIIALSNVSSVTGKISRQS